MRIYENSELMQVAKRENNTKRIYLLVNPLQGKHIPAIPSQVMELFEQLSQCLQRDCKGERLTVIGFAETATAIGAGAALGCPQAQYYICLLYTSQHTVLTGWQLSTTWWKLLCWQL